MAMKWLAIMLALLPSIALAQQTTPETQALGAKLMQELNAGLQCNAALISLQQRLKTAEEEIKRLTDKYEPKGK